MREIKLRKGLKTTKVLIYSDIDQMPVEVFQKANKYWMLSDELGGSFEDIEDKHLKKIAFVAKDEKRVLDAVAKMRTAINLILSETNVEHLSFAATVYSIDGKEVTDRSEESLKAVLKKLSDRGLTNELIKKKMSGKKYLGIWRSISLTNLEAH